MSVSSNYTKMEHSCKKNLVSRLNRFVKGMSFISGMLSVYKVCSDLTTENLNLFLNKRYVKDVRDKPPTKRYIETRGQTARKPESHLKVYFTPEVLGECREVIRVQADGPVELGVNFANFI